MLLLCVYKRAKRENARKPVDRSIVYTDRPKLPDGFEGGTWEKLRHAVSAVQKAEAVGTSFEELYQVCATHQLFRQHGTSA